MVMFIVGDPINCQTSSGVESKVLDDYCWIHSTFHIRNEYQVKSASMSNIHWYEHTHTRLKCRQGNVGCIVDPELVLAQQSYSGMSLYYDAAPRLPPRSDWFMPNIKDRVFFLLLVTP